MTTLKANQRTDFCPGLVLLISCVCLVHNLSNAQQGWVQQVSGTTNTIQAVSFTDVNTGTAVGINSTILRTTNGGTTWALQFSGSTSLCGVSFSDANTGVAVGYNGTVLRTTNAGLTWVSQTSGSYYSLYAVSLVNATTGTAVGNYGTILRTTDGGVTWTSQTVGTTSTLRGVCFTDANTGTAVGDGGTILRTINGGATWTSQYSATTNTLYAVDFSDANTGSVVAGSGEIFRTTNGGATWTRQSSGTSNTLYGVSFADANNGVAVGSSGIILRTSNGGANWTSQSSVTTSTLNAVSLAGIYTGTIVGTSGIILRATTAADAGAAVTTNSATNVATTLATLNGTINPNGLATTAFFEWGTSSTLPTYSITATTSQSIGSGTSAVPVTANLTGLTANTTYYYRMVAQNSAGTQRGSIVDFTPSAAQQGWVRQGSGTTNTIQAVSFTDVNTGTAVGSGSTILRTTNGGTTWALQFSGSTSLYGVSFADANNGVAVGSSGTILRTTDGSTWVSQTSGSYYSLYAVSLVNATLGTAVGDYGTILRTTDGGVTWTSQTVGTTSTLRGVCFTDANTGTAVGDGGTILRTINGGATWASQYSATTNTLYAVDFSDANTGSVVAGSGEIFRTTDGGTTWARQSSGTSNTLYGVSFADANNGVAVGNSGIILRTSNGGAAWTSQSSVTTSTLNAVSLAGIYTGTIVGTSGIILRATTAADAGAAVTTNSATGVTTTSATLNGTVNPNSLATTVYFEWGTSSTLPTYSITTTTSQSIGSGTSVVPVTANLTGLTANTTYYYRMVAQNSAGTQRGSIVDFAPSAAQQGWVRQVSGTTNTIQAVSFTDVNTGTAVGSGSTILRTTNGGTTWALQFSGSTTLYGVSFCDANTGVAVGSSGAILRTTNAGLTWASQTKGYYSLYAVSLVNVTTGTAVGDYGTILRTTDGGVTWTSQTVGTTSTLRGVCFTDANTGTAVGDGGTILRTINGGVTWTSQYSATTNTLYAVYFSDVNTGTVVAASGEIFRTTNGGTTWARQSSGTSNTLYGVSFADANNGIAVGSSGIILRTSNGGANWTSQSSVTTSTLYAVSLASSGAATVLGSSGTIFATTAGGGAAPTVSSSAATGITETSGTLNGTVNPNSLATTAYFEWGTSSTLATSSSTTSQSIGVGTSAIAVTANLTGLNPNTPYYYRAVGQNSVGTQKGSILSFTTIALAVPSTPSLSSPSNGATAQATTLTLSWATSAGATKYHVQVSTTSAFTTLVVSDSSLVGTSASVGPLANGTTYYWRVRAGNSSGWSSYSGSWSFATIAAAPSAPVLASPTSGATGVSTSATLTWNASGGATSYRLQVSTVSTFSILLVDQSGITGTSYGLTGLATGTVYYWRVNATNAGGASGWSAWWSLTTAATSRLLGEYTPDANTVLLLHMNETSGTTLADASTYGNNGAATGTTIGSGRFGKARSFNGWSDYLLVPSASNLAMTSYTIEAWINLSYASSFRRIVVQKGPVGSYELAIGDSSTGMTIVSSGTVSISGSGMTKVNPNVWHHIAATFDLAQGMLRLYLDGIEEDRVKPGFMPAMQDGPVGIGANSVGTGGYFSGVIDEVRISNIARSPREFNLQLPPVNLTATASGTSINLSWQNGGGAVGLLRYKIYCGSDSTSISLIDSTSSLLFSNTGLTPGTRYFYRVTAVDSAGFEGARSYAASATTGATSQLPTVATNAATNIASTSATLNGSVNPNGLASTAWFEWGTSSTLATYASTPSRSIGSGSNVVSVAENLTGLSPGVMYYYRAVGQNSAGTSKASIISLTTAVARQDYYVNASTGSNTPGNGSQANPWKTITYALGQISASGNTVRIAAGTYDTNLGETFPILLIDGVSLIGAGSDVSIVDAKGTNTVIKAVSIIDPTTVVKGLAIQGGGNTNQGGGLFITAGSALKVDGCKITSNNVSTATAAKRYGGGIYILNSSPTILNCEISGNTVMATRAPTDPSDFGAYGAGVAIAGNSSPQLQQNVIRDNEAQNSFFALAYGAGVYVAGSATPLLESNTILRNMLRRLYATSGTTLGAGISIENSSGVYTSNAITSNGIKADYGSLTTSSGVYIAGSSSKPKILRNVVAGNTDHGIWCELSATPTILNNTIAENTGDGIYLLGASPDSIVNNIFALNSNYGIEEGSASSDPGRVQYNLFYANSTALYRDEASTDYVSATTLNSGVAECKNNLAGDPQFVDRANRDYRLRLGSPAIDAGNPGSALDPDGTRADIGAFYYTPIATIPSAPSLSSPTNNANLQPVTLSLNWGSSAGATKYHLQVSITSAFLTFVVNDSSIIGTSSSVGPLASGTAHYWRVRAGNSAGWSSFSASWSFTTLGSTQPPTITSFTPSRNALSVDKSSNLTLTFNSDINSATLTNSTVRINGSLSGLHPGVFSYNSGTRTVTIPPTSPFSVGERVTVTATRSILNNAGDSLQKSCTWSFTIKGNRASGTFTQSSTPAVGINPKSIVAGDFDRDGDIDIATGNLSSGTVSILLNNGRGSFTQSSTPSVGNYPYSITAADFDRDGDIDLAVANYNSKTISILMNNGSGAFSQSSTPVAPGAPQSITSGDFNGDGAIDLAVADYGSTTASIFFNNGNGVFTLNSSVVVGSSPKAITSGDFNGDGYLDLAVARPGVDSTTILLNNGDGTFTKSSSLGVGSYPTSLAAGDFDGDGDLDIAVGNESATTCSILINNGVGVFTQSSTPTLSGSPYSIAPADLDGDGDIDLAVANDLSLSTSAILQNNGGGAFGQSSTTSVGSGPGYIVAGDWDGDGVLDLAVANQNSHTVSVLLNTAIVAPSLIGEYTPDANTVLLLHMNETSGSTASDQSGYGNNGTATGTTIVDGRFGKTRYFDGVSDQISVAVNNVLHPSNTITVEAWAKATGPGLGNTRLIRDASAKGYVLAWQHQDMNVQFRIDNGTSTARAVDPQIHSIYTNSWHHFAGTYDVAAGVRLYVDGALVGTGPPNGPLTFDSGVLSIGTGGPSIEFFKGLIDEVRISNVVRSPQEFNLQLPPKNLTATASGTTINLSWQNAGGAVGLLRYKIYRGADSTTVSLIDSTSSILYSNTGLTPGTRYFYRTSAVDSTGFEGARSYAASAQTGTGGGLPTAATSAAAGIGSTTATLNGSVNPNGLQTNAWFEWGTINTLSTYSSTASQSVGSGTSTVSVNTNLTSLSPSTMYYFRIAAQNSSGTQRGSIQSFTSLVQSPDVVSLSSPADGATGQPVSLLLSWSPAARAATYGLQLSASSTFASAIVDDSTLTTTSRLVGPLSNNTLYYWRVCAKNAGGVSAWSSLRSFTTVVIIPVAPTLITPLDNDVNASVSPTLNWNAVTGATSYRLQLSTASDFAATVSDQSGLTSTSRTVTSLANGTKYYWRVNASNAAGAGPYSATRSFTTFVSAPSAPVLSSPGTGSSNQPTTVTLAWNASAGATKYRLQVSQSAAFASTIFDDSTLISTSRQMGSLSFGTTYYWRVSASNTSGSSSYSATSSFATIPAPAANLPISTSVAFPARSRAGDFVASDYRLVGLPGSTSIPIASVLSGTQKKDWQVYWDNGASSNYFVEYDGSSRFEFGSGKAFWIVSKNALTINRSVTSPTLNTSGNYEISLQPGWNLISNPFSSSIPWSRIQSANTTTASIFTHNGSFASSVNFDPYVGYYYFNGSPGTVLSVLKVPYFSLFGNIEGPIGQSFEGWKVTMVLSPQGAQEETPCEASFGISLGAKKDMDEFDVRKPHSLGLATELFFDRPDWDAEYPTFVSDIRDRVNDVETWNFKVNTEPSRPARLVFGGISEVPSSLAVYLVDEANGRSANLRLDSVYSFVSPLRELRFSIFVGSRDAVLKHTSQTLPADYDLSHNFPNPFNPTTSLRLSLPAQSPINLAIFNILGQKIRTLYIGGLPAGIHWFTWDGKDDRMAAAPSGVYYCRLEIEGRQGIVRRMVLVK